MARESVLAPCLRELKEGGGGDNEALMEKFSRLDNVRSGDAKFVKHKKILPEPMVPKFTKTHCCKEVMVVSSK